MIQIGNDPPVQGEKNCPTWAHDYWWAVTLMVVGPFIVIIALIVILIRIRDRKRNAEKQSLLN